MAPKPQNAKPVTGIPRTHTAAKKLGYGKAKYNFADLSDKQKKSFMQFGDGASGSVCGVAPSPDPGYWLVCYKDANGQCNWVHVPKGQVPQAHE